MDDPDGVLRVYLAQGAQASMMIRVGQTLDAGYVVKAIGPTAVTLEYPPLGATVIIPLPASVGTEAGSR